MVAGGIGASYVGGFCGLSDGSILNCYFLNTAGPNNGLAMPLTHYAMKQQSSFSNWDFVGEAVNGTSSTWSIKPETYPSLHYFDPTFVLYEFTGQGTKQDPYRICEPNDLGAIWQQPGCYYQLQNDIDLAGITWPMAVIPTFRGMFDGNDYTLFNLNISGGSFLGLFGASRMSVLITSLSLEDVNVTGGDNSLYLGGLCSSNSGCIINCYATGSVTGGDESWFLGGLCGWNSFGSISNCYSTVSVTGGDEAYYLSGLSGNYVGSVDSCYATGTVTGGNASNSVGGLCGCNAYGGISNSYSTGIVSGGTGSVDLGGLCGISEFGTISSCYFLDSTGTHNGLGTPLTDSEMKQQNSFTGWDFVDETANGTSSSWIIHAGQYPSLFYFDPTFVPHVFIGQGTEPDPYRIYNTNDLGAIRQQPDSYYQLQNDIDLAGISWSVAVIPAFLGTLDGNNYSISNLNLSGGSILGLFGFLQTGASVTSLGLENANITGGAYSHSISSLCGLNNYGIISNCYSTGTVTGDEYLGGTCGSNYGSISNCYAAGSIIGGDSLGGLCGYNGGGTISNCYATSPVTGDDRLGGLCGFNRGTITNCYAAGSITGDNYLGGLCGYDYEGTITNCFWDVETSGRADGVGNQNPDPDGVIGKTTAQMQTQGTFTTFGWDFMGEDVNGTDDFWRMCVDGIDYPKLSWQFLAGDFVCRDGVNLTDFAVLAETWGLSSGQAGYNKLCDLIDDDMIDLDDLAVFVENWLAGK